MDTFQQTKNASKSFKKYDNNVAVNSNDKGLQMMRFVHDLQVYKNPQKKLCLCESLLLGLLQERS